MPRIKHNWELWNCRIRKELSDAILQYAPKLKELHKIDEETKYDIQQYALEMLLVSLRKAFPSVEQSPTILSESMPNLPTVSSEKTSGV